MIPEQGLLQPPPLGLYVHLPWCVRKCPYCDFNSHQLRDQLPFEEYTQALLADLEQDLPLVWGRPVSTIYFGGGTPSLFSAAQIDLLISGIRARLPVVPSAEITLEANPGTIERDSFEAYRQAGINRVSLGAQSFSDQSLLKIGRIHGRDEIGVSLDSLIKAGISNFNIDLMYGLPGQTTEGALEDVRLAMKAGPAHISHYQLTIEPNTAFASAPPRLPEEDSTWEMQIQAAELLAAGDFEQYEISAWARPGHGSRHNLNYWRYGDFLGVGAGAHAKLTDVAANVIRRRSKQRHPKQFITGDFVAEDRVITEDERVFEYFLNRLRLREPIRPGDFSARTGLSWNTVLPRVDLAIKKDLLEESEGNLQHTETGWRFVNDIQAMFLP